MFHSRYTTIPLVDANEKWGTAAGLGGPALSLS